MIQQETMLEVADNTGAKKLKCIKVLGGSKRRTAQVGDIIVCSVREATPNAIVKVGDVVYVLVVRTKAPLRRKDGTQLRFDGNAGVIIDKVKRDPKGTRIFGPIPREIKDRNFLKVASAAPEVL